MPGATAKTVAASHAAVAKRAACPSREGMYWLVQPLNSADDGDKVRSPHRRTVSRQICYAEIAARETEDPAPAQVRTANAPPRHRRQAARNESQAGKRYSRRKFFGSDTMHARRRCRRSRCSVVPVGGVPQGAMAGMTIARHARQSPLCRTASARRSPTILRKVPAFERCRVSTRAWCRLFNPAQRERG